VGHRDVAGRHLVMVPPVMVPPVMVPPVMVPPSQHATISFVIMTVNTLA
jgi:hypothetical protein